MGPKKHLYEVEIINDNDKIYVYHFVVCDIEGAIRESNEIIKRNRNSIALIGIITIKKLYEIDNEV